jgi:drug/metabolite transporter (DMT)-like permease
MNCTACGTGDLERVKDRRTGREARAGGRWLMRCKTCGHVEVLSRRERSEREGRRRWTWWIATGAGLSGTLSGLLYEFGRARAETYVYNPDEEPQIALQRMVIPLMLGAILFSLSHLLGSLYGLFEERDPKRRVDAFALALFWCAFLCLFLCVAVGMYGEFGYHLPWQSPPTVDAVPDIDEAR